MSGTKHRAVVLLSGGLDSSTTLAIARDEGFETHALSLQYSQRNSRELDAARAVACALNAARHVILDLDLSAWGGSALTAPIEVPKDRDLEGEEIPATYVPGRNIIFLSLASAWAETLNARDLFIGVNALDYSGYPDCRPEFIRAFEEMINLGTRAGVEGRALRIHAPLIHLSKAEIIRRGQALGVDYGLTWSCYDPLPDGRPCGRCDSCRLRRKGFREAGLHDPLSYPE